MSRYLHVDYTLIQTPAYQAARPMLRLVVLAVAGHANDKTGACNPSIQTLSEITGADNRHVRRLLREAVTAGMLKITERPGKSNLFTLSDPGYVIPRVQDTPGTSCTLPRVRHTSRTSIEHPMNKKGFENQPNLSPYKPNYIHDRPADWGKK